ncbi:RNA polymerase III Rpc82 C -terminal [Penicillium riverlandense]|uniref:RNA polymerase III Rpc82 C -terminal n=1 Tax=Penicillium riverlandense TaxID=1903569 RepID=UPI002547215D|nr:RNA polymerase III Rpc82 C -terminal [Penicillium riverlandense]KAJ5833188.1 RNA polymerase III Rpc82 C -terminal [Penicillium riverlandense]
MTSKFAAELCTLLVEDHFGELFACIFSTLQRYERLTLPRLKFYSRLTERQVHHGLAAMIQQHLVYHYTSLEDGITYYEANPQSAYYLVRSGKIIHLVQDRLGKYAAKVMSAILFLGHAPISYLETLPELRSSKPMTNGVNHDAASDERNGDHHERPPLLHPTLTALASHGYIMRVREAHLQSPADNWLDAERTVSARPDIKSLKGKKQQEAIAHETAELVAERTDGDLTRGLIFNGLPRGIKRKSGHGSGTPKKHARMDHGMVNGDGSREEGVEEEHEKKEEENDWLEDEDGYDTAPMDSGIVVRVNYPKLDVALRNARFIELAANDSSAVTAEVYGCLLRRIEYQTSRCRESAEIPREGEEGEQYSAPIKLSAIVEDVDPQLDLAGSIGPMDPSQTTNRRGKRPLTNGVNGDDHDHDNQDPIDRTDDIDQHLRLLAQPPYNLTSLAQIGGLSTWRIEFRHLARKLRHLELETLIESRFGDVALRVVRVLHAKGKLDEKRLQEITMLPFKDLRQTLAGMQSGGFVDLQEVPRDAQRQPSKTIYLWYYDPDRICGSVLEDTYKAMSRTLQRLNFEREREKDFLEKTERSDVKGNEERYLSAAELEYLERWRAREAKYLSELARLDDMVAVFRDY